MIRWWPATDAWLPDEDGPDKNGPVTSLSAPAPSTLAGSQDVQQPNETAYGSLPASLRSTPRHHLPCTARPPVGDPSTVRDLRPLTHGSRISGPCVTPASEGDLVAIL